jgi:hypothetical protein
MSPKDTVDSIRSGVVGGEGEEPGAETDPEIGEELRRSGRRQEGVAALVQERAHLHAESPGRRRHELP